MTSVITGINIATIFAVDIFHLLTTFLHFYVHYKFSDLDDLAI